MIRARSAAAAGAAVIGLAVVFGQRPAAADLAAPQDRIATIEAYHDRAVAASVALERLAAAIEPGRDAGRRGSARIVAGDEPPGPLLSDAAAALEAAGDEADTLAGRLDQVRGSTAAAALPATPAGAEVLSSIAAQLRETAIAGDEFAAMRHRAEEVADALDGALTALGADDTGAAAEQLAAARERHEILSAWEPGLITLPIWLDTTARLLDAIDDLIAAIDAGDADAAAAAGEAVAALGDDAREADVALSLAISEGGGAIAQAPLQRLANVLRAVDEVRAQLAAIVDRGTPIAE